MSTTSSRYNCTRSTGGVDTFGSRSVRMDTSKRTLMGRCRRWIRCAWLCTSVPILDGASFGSRVVRLGRKTKTRCNLSDLQAIYCKRWCMYGCHWMCFCQSGLVVICIWVKGNLDRPLFSSSDLLCEDMKSVRRPDMGRCDAISARVRVKYVADGCAWGFSLNTHVAPQSSSSYKILPSSHLQSLLHVSSRTPLVPSQP